MALSVCLAGCVLNKAKTAAAPPAPQPTVASAPAPEPLSIPQTQVELPPPQPLTPEAIATTQIPEEQPTPSAPAPATPTRPRPSTPRTEVVPQGPAVPAAAPPPAEPERPPIQEALPAAELKQMQEEAEARTRETRQLMGEIEHRRLNRQEEGIRERVLSFLQQSAEAEQRGDMRQADELAGRALVLARELKP
jgi:hypothetical protein